MSSFNVTTQANAHPPHLVRPCDTCKARDYSACAPLNAEEQKRLVAIMRIVEVEPHRAIFDEAEPAENVYNVTAGAVKIYKLLPDGRRQITGFLFPGDFLGLTHNEAYAYSAEALAPTKLCRFPRRKLEGLLDESRKSARERIVSFILMLSDAAVRHGEPADPVFLPMNRSDIADYLGLTIETVSRFFTRLKTQGLIQLVDERRIRLARPEALREIAAGF